MIRILHHNTVAGLFAIVTIWVLRLLDWSESSLIHFVVLTISFINCVSCSWWNTHWLASRLNIPLTNILLLYWFMNSLKHSWAIVCSTSWCVLSSCWEESSLLTLRVFVLCSVKSIIFSSSCVLGSISTCSNTSNMCSICGITVFSLHWLDHRIIEINNKIFVDGILIRRFRLSNGMSSSTVVVSSCLSSSMECCNSFIGWSILLVIVLVNSTMLDCLVIEWITSVLYTCLNWASYEFIKDFSSIFYLIWMKWSSHIQILFLLLRNNALICRMVCSSSFLTNNFSFI